jgi:hypothetical protein
VRALKAGSIFITRSSPAVSEIVALMRGYSRHLSGRRPIEGDSEKTDGFSAQKSCVEKRVVISEWGGDARYNSVVF